MGFLRSRAQPCFQKKIRKDADGLVMVPRGENELELRLAFASGFLASIVEHAVELAPVRRHWNQAVDVGAELPEGIQWLKGLIPWRHPARAHAHLWLDRRERTHLYGVNRFAEPISEIAAIHSAQVKPPTRFSIPFGTQQLL